MKKVFVALFLVASLFVVSLSVFAHDASHSSGLCEGDVLVFNGEEYVVYFYVLLLGTFLYSQYMYSLWGYHCILVF